MRQAKCPDLGRAMQQIDRALLARELRAVLATDELGMLERAVLGAVREATRDANRIEFIE